MGPYGDRVFRTQGRNEPSSFIRIGDLQAVRDEEHVGVDPGEDLVEGHHDQDGQRQPEVAEKTANLYKILKLKKWNVLEQGTLTEGEGSVQLTSSSM